MVDFERIDALARLVREKGVNREILLNSLHRGLERATEKEYGTPQEIKVTWDQDSGDIKIQALKTVVEKVDPDRAHLEITPARAKKYDSEAGIGDQVAVPIRISDFGRSSVNMFRQEFLSLVKGAEREQVYKEFIDRVGEIIPRCRVQQVYRSRILVQVAGRVEGIVPVAERARYEMYDQGESITPVLIEVRSPESSEPQLVLSRATPLLIQKLFEREAPEIEEGVVEIRAIAREAGVRTKIAVASNDFKVDAVGTFVGSKGSRVQAVMRELSGERIDVVPWTLDKTVLATHALLPATVMHVEIERYIDPETGEEKEHMIAVVPDDELSLAIGKHGHNVRLAGRLVGYRIDAMTQSEWTERRRWEEARHVDLSEIECVSDALRERLRLAGFDTANRVVEADIDELSDVKGIGPVTLKKLLAEAEEKVARREETVSMEMERQRLEKELEEAQEDEESEGADDE
ncbi:MAG: transcription termination factor NusA [Candidatus Fermentibacteraceae bacterium]